MNMKKRIDELVREILRHLGRPKQADPQVETVLAASGLDGLGLARTYRTALANLAEHGALSADDRAYARQQFDTLPDF
jgi:hypothetical protein